MSNVIVKENETLDSALRRFKRSCAKAGIQQEIRKREHYEKPSVRRKKKSEAARKRKYNWFVQIGRLSRDVRGNFQQEIASLLRGKSAGRIWKNLKISLRLSEFDSFLTDLW